MNSARRTSIVCTIGPATSSEEQIGKLIDAGMDVARLNFSHGTHASHSEVFGYLRQQAQARGKYLAVLQDLSGPKIRLGEVKPGVVLQVGQEYVFTSEQVVGDEHRAHISYPTLAQDVKVGNCILLDDGLLELKVVKMDGELVYTEVVVGGPISSHKGVNLPGASLSVSPLTEKDSDDLRFGLKLGVDYVALSFVREASDVELVRKVMAEVGIRRPVIAKIEKPEAVEHIEEILEAFDGLMVARGDLGVEMPLEDIPVVQKRIIRAARDHYKPVITATQMLDSMIRNPRPTRAEVTDVANAIWDGTDAIMLSGETASGAYPLEAVQVMDHVARHAEECLPYHEIASAAPDGVEDEKAIALAAVEIAEASGSAAILTCTSSGRSACLVSHYRPRAAVVGVAHDETVARQISLMFGVVPLYVDCVNNVNVLVHVASKAALAAGLIKKGNKVVVVAGIPTGKPANFIHLMTI